MYGLVTCILTAIGLYFWEVNPGKNARPMQHFVQNQNPQILAFGFSFNKLTVYSYTINMTSTVCSAHFRAAVVFSPVLNDGTFKDQLQHSRRFSQRLPQRAGAEAITTQV